jgi:hypothetical protein
VEVEVLATDQPGRPVDPIDLLVHQPRLQRGQRLNPTTERAARRGLGGLLEGEVDPGGVVIAGVAGEVGAAADAGGGESVGESGSQIWSSSW